MAKHKVLIEKTAERDLKKLPRETFNRIGPHIAALGDDPRPAGCKKLAGAENSWRIRVGDYRVIYEIDDPALIVRIMRVRHRSGVYQ